MSDILYSREEMVNTLKVISSNHSPKIFLPFILTVIPSLALAVLTFGISLIFTGFIWIKFDNYIFEFLNYGKTSFKQFFKWDKQIVKYFYTSIIRRLMILLSIVCFVVPVFFIAPALSLLPYIIDRHNDINNPFALIKISFDMALPNLKALMLINLTTVYIYFLLIISFGIIAPWGIPYLRMLKTRFYCILKGLNINDDLLPTPEFDDDTILPTYYNDSDEETIEL